MPLVAIPNGKREHAVQPAQHPQAPLRESVEQDFAVRSADKAVAARRKFGSKLLEIENLAIEDHRVTAIGRRHRLLAKRRQIDDGKTPMAEADRSIDKLAFAVGAAMGNDIGHRLDAHWTRPAHRRGEKLRQFRT